MFMLISGNPEFGDKLKAVYRHTLFLSKCFGLPCIATQVCLNSGVQEEVAYLHLGFSALPVIAHFLEDKHEKNLLDTVMLGNLISVAYFSYVSVNYYGFALVVSYAVNHFVIRTDGTAFDTSIPSLDLFMYGLCFFYFFAVKTLSDWFILFADIPFNVWIHCSFCHRYLYKVPCIVLPHYCVCFLLFIWIFYE